jgi:hypothetical protein
MRPDRHRERAEPVKKQSPTICWLKGWRLWNEIGQAAWGKWI